MEHKVTICGELCPFCNAANAFSINDYPLPNCISCGQPRLETPSGMFALTTQMLTYRGRPAMRLYVLPHGDIEAEVIDLAAAKKISRAIAAPLGD